MSKKIHDFWDAYHRAVVLINSEGTPIYCNTPFTVLSGYESSRLPQLPFADLFVLGGKPLPLWQLEYDADECLLQKADGTFQPVKITVSPFTFPDGKMGKVYTFLPARESERAGVAVAYDEALQEWANTSPLLLRWIDAHTQGMWYNRSWCEFMGQDAPANNVAVWQACIHPQDSKQVVALREKPIESGRGVLEFRALRQDGTYASILEVHTPYYAADGKCRGWLCTGIDVTDKIRSAQEKVETLEQALHLSQEEMEQFAHVVSHDLQEPLRIIAGYVQLIKKRIDAGQTAGISEFVDFTVGGATRMQNLLRDLLVLSRITSRGNPFSQISMKDLLRAVIADLKSKNIAPEIIYNDELPDIHGDSLQLTILWKHLIENAAKFVPKGVQPKVIISVREEDGFWQFSLKDNGIGIDRKFYNRIFTIFQRLHSRDDYEGTGAGLAICKKIVQRHGGTIWVQSEIGSGSTFFFTLKKQP